MFEKYDNLVWPFARKPQEQGQTKEKTEINRRDLLKMGGAGLVAAAAPLLIPGQAHAARGGAHHVAFRFSNTGETYSGVYRVGDKYLPEAFEQINFVMRDFRTGEIFPMDPHVIDILSALQRKTRTAKPTDILSAYRSPHTNANLRRGTRGVARNSFHMYGQALDMRMPDIGVRQLRETAKSLKAGGVGSYPRFVHVDTGDVRSWS